MENPGIKQSRPDQTPNSVASDLGLHCLPMTILRGSKLEWVKSYSPCQRASSSGKANRKSRQQLHFVTMAEI